MTALRPLERVLDRVIVAVIRAESPDLLVDVAEALVAGGVEVMEVTLHGAAGDAGFGEGRGQAGQIACCWGPARCSTPETARAAILAGRSSSWPRRVNLQVIEICRRYSKLVMPGRVDAHRDRHRPGKPAPTL